MLDLKQAVRDRIASLGVAEAQKFFGVSAGTVSNWSSGKTPPSIAAGQKLLDEVVPMMAPPLTVADYPTVTWSGKKVMLLLPSYKTVNPHTHFTLFANYAKYGPDKVGMAVKDRTVIHEARNELIHIGMQSPDVETFIMADDDMVFPCGNENIFNGNYRMGVKPESARLNAIERLMSHGRDKQIVGALYYGRHENGMPQCDWGFNAQAGVLANELRGQRYQGLHKMDWVGTGLIKIERTAIDIYKQAIDEGKYPELKPLPGRWYGYFNAIRAGVGEDVSFCVRMKELGVESYLDASLVCGHIGETIFSGRNTTNRTTGAFA